MFQMSDPMLDTDQLRSFLAIVDTGSFTRAAERVNKTQSAVSMHIRRLEEQLGCSLFAKNGRGVRLSLDGEKLIDYARRMLQIEASALSSIAQKGLAGRVRLGMPDDYAEPFLPDILTRFSTRHPLVEVSVVCEASVALAERIHARDLDLAVVTDCGAIKGVEVIREERLVWIAGPHAKIDLDQPLALAMGGPTCQWRRAAMAAIERSGISVRTLMVSNNYAAIAPVVRAGLAIGVLPLGVIRGGLRVVQEGEGLPALPPAYIGLIETPAGLTREAHALADDIRATLRPPAPGPELSADAELGPGPNQRRARAAA
jgi:DNA-binding transcriptional LysR family regulator